jgi:hypothetical protein
MANLIPGYEYDIFINYRQKDNKVDRWVSDFVEALKIELDKTFFDESGYQLVLKKFGLQLLTTNKV